MNDLGVPEHPFAIGLTVTVAIEVDETLVTAAKDGMLPDPPADNPMVVFELVQLYNVPVTVPKKFIVVVIDPLHNC